MGESICLSSPPVGGHQVHTKTTSSPWDQMPCFAGRWGNSPPLADLVGNYRAENSYGPILTTMSMPQCNGTKMAVSCTLNEAVRAFPKIRERSSPCSRDTPADAIVYSVLCQQKASAGMCSPIAGDPAQGEQ